MPIDTAKLLFTFFMAPWLLIVAVATGNLPAGPMPYISLGYMLMGIMAIRIWAPEIMSAPKLLARSLLLRWALPILVLAGFHFFVRPLSPFTLGVLASGLFARGALLSTRKISQSEYQYILDNNINFEPQKDLFLCPVCKADLTGSDTLNCPGCNRSYTLEEFLKTHQSKHKAK